MSVAGAAACLLRIFTSARTGAAGAAIEIQFTSLTFIVARSRSSLRPIDHAPRGRLGRDHVERLAGGDAQARAAGRR